MSAKLEEGTVFAGRYRVVRCLAAGGMGAVYEVVHLETDRRRALKVMHPHLFQSEEMRERFKREARIAAQVDSEYIVDVSDAGVDEATKTPFLIMELLRGEELGDRLKRMGRLPPTDVVSYMQQTAWALDRTHAASIVHRDLKPENLFLTTREDGSPRIKILDFGVAKLIAEGATAAGATRSLGTPLYMAPEQFRAGTKLTAMADIHALTLMTYTLLVGVAYWAEEARCAGDVIAFAMVVVNGPKESAVTRAARHGVTLPPGFDAWFAKGTAVNPTDRFPTATDAVRALRTVDGAMGTGVVPTASEPAMAVDAGISVPADRMATSSGSMLALSATSTGASAMNVTPVERSRLPLVGGAVVMGLSVIGMGAWLVLRPATSPQVVMGAPPVALAVPTASTATQVGAAPAPAAPAASAPVVDAPNTPVAAAPTAKGIPARKIAPPAVSGEKPRPSPPLLGRDQ
jgi:serine/threonine-protein kinase